MERLTKTEIKIECISDKTKSRLTDDYIEKVKLNNKLCEVENFMEKWKFDHIEEMDKFLTSCEKAYLTQEKELKAYKQMWDELRKYIEEMKEGDLSFHDNEHDLFILVENVVLNKMQELEKSAEVDNGNND